MYIYAGIDEAGYGPMFGPLVVGRFVMGVTDLPTNDDSTQTPAMWELLSRAVCKNLSKRHGRIPVNDSKKLRTRAAGIKYLELGVLAFTSLAGQLPADTGQWLDRLGEHGPHRLDLPPLPLWYQPTDDQPWDRLPCANTVDELAIAKNVLSTATDEAGVEVLNLGASVVFEDQFNTMVAATRSKAAVNFTFVARHLRAIWDKFSQEAPVVVVDRQSGRTHYRSLLAMNFPDAGLTVLDETPIASVYQLTSQATQTSPTRTMTVRFQVDSETQHMPVALASMISKYTRELLMARFQAWFARRAPDIKPTAGYALDAKRFWSQIQPLLPELSITPDQLRRMR